MSVRNNKILKKKVKQSYCFFKNDIFNHPLGKGSLKDFFIPHSGNNHKPHALHPKRVLFHVSSALVIKAIVVLVMLQYPLTAWMTPDVIAGESKKIISQTNSLRSSLSLSTLSENQKLDQAAYEKVQDMFLQQYFAHRSPSGLGLDYWAKQGGYNNYYVIGENLAVGYNNATEVMSAWRNSPTHYKNLVEPLYKDIGVSLVGGKYKGEDTVFIAQYFGALQVPENSAPAVSETKIEKVAVAPPAVLSEQSVKKEKPLNNTTEKSSSKNQTQATVVVRKTAGTTNEKAVEAKAILPSDTTAASVTILNQKVALEPKANGQWEGRELIISPVESPSATPAILTVNNGSGETTALDISAENIVPEQASIFDQYSLYKSLPNSWLNRIFSISTIYYEILLVIALGALTLNVAIARHKQHPHLIASGVGLIVSLFFLIIL